MSDTAHAHAKAVELGKLILGMTTAAGSGHPSTALAIVHIVIELMYRTMRYDPADPWHPASDRLVLSIGHGVPAVYAAYADLGGAVGRDRDSASPLTIEALQELRAQESVLDGHPNPGEGFPFFDAATGSLGQGLSAAAGLALAARLDGIDKRIYVVAGDGESREGQFWEAADFIVDHRLNNVCAVVSCNGHGQAGPVSAQQSPDQIAAKFESFGWRTIHLDGHDPEALHSAFAEFPSPNAPTAILARTVKGWGVALMQLSNYHGKPVPEKSLARACAELDETGNRIGAAPGGKWTPSKPPHTPPPRTGNSIALPPLAQALDQVGMSDAMKNRKLATRAAYGAALVALGNADPRVVSLDGDVSNSTYANFFADAHPDRFFECKIAEQNMVTAAVGLAAAGKIPFASSFGKFLERALDQVDMAAITRANIKLVGSHTGVSLAADGPSQMAVTDVAYFRSMSRVDRGDGRPACRVFHPSDAVSAYRLTELAANTEGMCYVRTHRPNADFLYADDELFDLTGCKQLRQGDRLTLVSAGYMLHVVLQAAGQLAEKHGLVCGVFDAYAFPLDATAILDAARAGGGRALVVEDNYSGGLHSELAEQAAETGDVQVFGMTVRRIPKSARSAEEVFDHTGIGLDQIVTRARELAR